ncbi:MAG: DNA polymerase/3'-5' exonuclease PolX, partial [Desulfobulbaceae bacterium]|nr:DNA polymerase/3'-5' exonuclease PolX [Desulfobulbaceae bacterium]
TGNCRREPGIKELDTMPIHNADVAEIFNRIGDLLDIKGDNPFRIRAYRDGARTVSELSRSVAEMVEGEEDLKALPGIGKDLAAKIEEIVRTGSLSFLEKLEEEIPAGLVELLRISGLGPRKINALYTKLGITSLAQLREAVSRQKIRDLEGFGEKTEQNIRKELDRLAASARRIKLSTADEIARPLLAYLREIKGVRLAEIAGSYRRRMETVGDLDILVVHVAGSPVMERFLDYDDVQSVVSHGPTRSSALLKSGVQVDLRAVGAESYGAALLYFTGSKAHNIAVRRIAVKNDLKINEYGVFKGKKRVAGRTEEGVYKQVGLPFIPPELREDRGEIEAAAQDRLPNLLTLGDIRGDLHAHTTRTDGHAGLEEMALAARERGYEYLGITEHSRHVTVAGGLDADELRAHIRDIDRLNEQLEGIVLLKGIEVDILEDGSLDLPDDVLRELDYTVCSVHSRFNLPRDRQTARIIRAMDNPCFHILGHPSGRLINERPPYDIDMEQVIRAAAAKGCFMELNAHPDRLDLNDIHLKLARELGVKVAISTDAHSTEGLNSMRFGIWQARRGWLEPGDVLNTRSWPELKKIFRRG